VENIGTEQGDKLSDEAKGAEYAQGCLAHIEPQYRKLYRPFFIGVFERDQSYGMTSGSHALGNADGLLFGSANAQRGEDIEDSHVVRMT